MELQPLRTSRLPDTKNVFKHEEKEKAIKKRYGKDVHIAVTYDMSKDGKTLQEYTLRFQSPKNKHYTLTEYLKDDVTDHVIISYHKDHRYIENKFDRFLDAEVTLIDLLSEE